MTNNNYSNLYVHVKTVDGLPIGVYLGFAYTNAIVSGYTNDVLQPPFIDRFCYPRTDFSLAEVIEIANEWNVDDLPREGWVKYKGVAGDFRPDDIDEFTANWIKSQRLDYKKKLFHE